MSRLAEDLEESLLAVVVNRDSCKPTAFTR